MLRLILLLLIYPFPSHGCGSNGNFDREKLLAEQNSLYLFDFLDNSRDPSAAYRTHVHEQILHSDVNRDMDNYFYSFFIVEREVPCDQGTFNRVQTQHRAVRRRDLLRHFLVMVGSGTLRSIRDNLKLYNKKHLTILSDKKDKKFVDEVKKRKKYKYCVTTQKMTKQVAESRVRTLTSLFNFLFNNRNNLELNMDINYNNECITKEQTLNSRSARRIFSISEAKPFKFFVQKFKGIRKSGFADIAVTRPSSGRKKTFVILSTANRDDVIKYEGPVFFQEGETKATISLEVKTDINVEVSDPLKVELENREVAKLEIAAVEPYVTRCYIEGNKIDKNRPQIHAVDKMPIFSLPITEDKSLPWNKRCNTDQQDTTRTVLQDISYSENENVKKKELARAAMEILDAVYWLSDIKEPKRNKLDQKKNTKDCFSMMMYTVAIAQVIYETQPTIYLAGNLDFKRLDSPSNWVGFFPNDEADKRKIEEAISYILRKRNLIPSLYSDINVLKNPSGKKTHMSRHAEMQLTSYAVGNSKLVIENIGVSKTPCCMCNTVLNSQNLHRQIRGRQHDVNVNDEYLDDAHDSEAGAFGSHFGVYSGPGKDLCTITKDGPWCGSQYGALKAIQKNNQKYLGSFSAFDSNLKSWIHPRDMKMEKETWGWLGQSEPDHLGGA